MSVFNIKQLTGESPQHSSPESGRRPTGMHAVLELAVLSLIPRSSSEGELSITTKEIHERLKAQGHDRDIRSVQRKLNKLKLEYGFQSNADDTDKAPKPLRYWWGPESRSLNINHLSQQEALLMVMAEKQLRSMLPSGMHAILAGLFLVANKQLDKGLGHHLAKEWVNKVHVANPTQPLIPAENHPGVFEAVTEALYNNRWLKLSYVNKLGKAYRAEVMPLGLVQQGNKTLLVCRCEAWDNTGKKTLANSGQPIHWNLMVHRIQTAEAIPTTFLRPPDFDLAAYDRLGGFGVAEGYLVKLQFEMRNEFARSLLETPLSTDQEATSLKDGWWQIRATVPQTFILDHWLNGYQDAVRRVSKRKLKPVDGLSPIPMMVSR